MRQVRRPVTVSDTDYRRLAELRYQIRRFLRFSEQAARAAGLEPKQHQLLLAIRGMPEQTPTTVGALAERLQLAHHSAVELVDRLEQGGFVRRRRADRDRRRVLVALTPRGAGVLRELSREHLAELRSRGPELVSALEAVLTPRRSGGAEGAPPGAPAAT